MKNKGGPSAAMYRPSYFGASLVALAISASSVVRIDRPSMDYGNGRPSIDYGNGIELRVKYLSVWKCESSRVTSFPRMGRAPAPA